jgi:hypothetical protein
MTNTHPFDNAVNELIRKLEAAVKQRQEAEIEITAATAGIRALASNCEDEEVKTGYLVLLDEINGKPGFKDVILSILKAHPKGLTPKEVRSWILMGKKMDLSGYSNPLASIHTTLRRMSGNEAEEFVNDKGEKAWRIKPPLTFGQRIANRQPRIGQRLTESEKK